MQIAHWNSRLAGMLTATMLLAFMTGFIPFFQDALDAGGNVWRVLYYSFWLLSMLSAGLGFLTAPRELQRRLFVLLLLVAVMLGLCAMHNIDSVTKNFIVGTLFLGVFTVLAVTSAPASIARLGAWIVLLNASICFLDALHPVGFSNTLGRSAGLFVNPNVAGISLMLGSAATIQSVPRRWKISFCIVVGTAIVLTLSRSTAILTISMAIAALAARIFWEPTAPTLRKVLIRPQSRDWLVLASCIAWIAFAAVSNSRIPAAAESSFSTVGTAMYFFRDIGANLHLSSGETSAIDAIPNLVQLGDENSVSARKELMLRAANAFLSGPWNGIGLAASHELAPHDTYLLMAVAFGYLGAILSALLVFACIAACGLRNLAIPAAVAGAMLVSHDLLMPSLLSPIIVGISYYLAKPGRAYRYPSQSASKFIAPVMASVIIFIFGASTVSRSSAVPVSYALDPENFRPNIGYGYLSPLPRAPYSGLLTLTESRDANFRMIENGNPMTRSKDAEVEEVGNGRYAVEDGYVLRFAALGNADPTENVFSFEGVPRPHPILFPLLVLVGFWGVAVVAREAIARNIPAEPPFVYGAA